MKLTDNEFIKGLKQNYFCLDYPFSEEHRLMLLKQEYWRNTQKWNNEELNIHDKINIRSSFRFPVHFSNNKKYYNSVFEETKLKN